MPFGGYTDWTRNKIYDLALNLTRAGIIFHSDSKTKIMTHDSCSKNNIYLKDSD